MLVTDVQDYSCEFDAIALMKQSIQHKTLLFVCNFDWHLDQSILYINPLLVIPCPNQHIHTHINSMLCNVTLKMCIIKKQQKKHKEQWRNCKRICSFSIKIQINISPLFSPLWILYHTADFAVDDAAAALLITLWLSENKKIIMWVHLKFVCFFFLPFLQKYLQSHGHNKISLDHSGSV